MSIDTGDIRSKFEKFLKSVDLVVAETVRLEEREDVLQEGITSLKKRESEVSARESNILQEKHRIEAVERTALEKESKAVSIAEANQTKEAMLAKTREAITIKLKLIDKRMEELKEAENRLDYLKKTAEDLKKKDESLVMRESAIEKERQMARIRKESLDSLEAELARKQKRLQKYLDIYPATEVV